VISNDDYIVITTLGLTPKSTWADVKAKIEDELEKRGTPIAEGDERVPASGAYHIRRAKKKRSI